MARSRFVLVTGLSGSGKSTVAKAFEDLGYYCVDNLPLPLLRQLIASPSEVVEGYDRVAVITDVRAPGFASELPRLVAEADRSQLDLAVLFLEASEEALVRRFSETRRPHPLAAESPLIAAIREERQVLSELRGIADRVFDTSEWTIHEVRREVVREFGDDEDDSTGLVVSIVSFGFKFGIPYGTDLLYDVRFLPNPHFVPDLRPLTGSDRPVKDFLEREPAFAELVERVLDYLRWVLPQHARENRSYVSLAVGCTGGRHRSVAVAEAVAAGLKEDEDQRVHLVHRDAAR